MSKGLTGYDETITSLAGGEVRWYGHFGKQFRSFSPYDPTTSHQGVFSFLWAQVTTQRVVQQCSQQLCSEQPKTGNKSSVYQLENVFLGFIQEIPLSNKKEWITDMCHNTGKTQKHFANWQKPDVEKRQTDINRKENSGYLGPEGGKSYDCKQVRGTLGGLNCSKVGLW